MIEILREHPRAVMFAVIFHLVVVIVVGVSVDWTSLSKPTGDKAPVKIINAVAVDQKLVDKELKKIKDAEKKRIRKQKNAERKKKKAIADRKREEKKLKQLKNKTKKEKAKQLALKKKRKAKLKKEKATKIKAKQEQQRKAAEQQQKAAEQKRKEQFENELKKNLAAEESERQAVIAAANNARRQSEIGEYVDKIMAHIRSNWNDPDKAGKKSIFKVDVIPSGVVVKVKMTSSSSDKIFDRNAENAIWKASPLPLPPVESDLMDEFRSLTLELEGKAK